MFGLRTLWRRLHGQLDKGEIGKAVDREQERQTAKAAADARQKAEHNVWKHGGPPG